MKKITKLHNNITYTQKTQKKQTKTTITVTKKHAYKKTKQQNGN